MLLMSRQVRTQCRTADRQNHRDAGGQSDREPESRQAHADSGGVAAKAVLCGPRRLRARVRSGFLRPTRISCGEHNDPTRLRRC